MALCLSGEMNLPYSRLSATGVFETPHPGKRIHIVIA